MIELITLAPYNPQWKLSFEKEAELLNRLLTGVAVRVHHIGSTAVADLLAKPIIDIGLEASLFPPSLSTVQDLATLGYQYKGEAGVPGRYWFTKGRPRTFHLHFCPVGAAIIKKQILFRDRLQESLALRKRYELIKLQNYRHRAIDSAEYALAKSAFIEEVTGMR